MKTTDVSIKIRASSNEKIYTEAIIQQLFPNNQKANIVSKKNAACRLLAPSGSIFISNIAQKHVLAEIFFSRISENIHFQEWVKEYL